MSKENLQGFYDSVKDNEELIKAVHEAVVAGNVVVLAKEKGFEFTQAEHEEFMAEMESDLEKMSDDQLEEVAGGSFLNPQYAVRCEQCGWKSGWHSIYIPVPDLTYKVPHTVKTGHVSFTDVYR